MTKKPAKRRATKEVAGIEKADTKGKSARSPRGKARDDTDSHAADDIPRLVADLVLAGLGKAQVRAYLVAERDLRPGVSELDDLIEQAKADLAAQADHYREIATELTVVRLNDLYTRALKVQDLKTALEVQKAIINFLLGKTGGVKAPPAAEPAPQEPAEPRKPRLVGSYADVMEQKRRRRA